MRHGFAAYNVSGLLFPPKEAPQAALADGDARQGLEAPLQFEHHDIVWRPVTAGTCLDLLSGSSNGVRLGTFALGPPPKPQETFYPSGSLAEAIELALQVQEADGLPSQLRAESNRLATMVCAWHAERIARADEVHRDLRARWKDWS